MRRHLQISNIEIPDVETFPAEASQSRQAKLGILAFIFSWLVALAALASSAQGQELPPAARQNAGQEQGLTRFILVSLPDRQLALIDNGQVVKTYPVAVGASHSPTPEGVFTVVSQAKNPTYSHHGKVVLPGKDNPVGTRWIGLSRKGYGIHGTNVPASIGKAASHGCLRMRQDDVEELYKLVKVGDTVAIRRQGDDLTARVFGPRANPQAGPTMADSNASAGASMTANNRENDKPTVAPSVDRAALQFPTISAAPAAQR